jgi:hypothetical protein
LLLVALALAAGPRPSDAQLWTANGVALCTEANHQQAPTIVPDGAGGAIVTWVDYRNSTLNSDIYAQRVNAAGVPQWTAGGVALCTAANYQYSPTIVADGAGGAIVTWEDNRGGLFFYVYAQRVNAAGVPQWTANGVPLCTVVNHQRQRPTIVTDGAAGAIVTWYDSRSNANNIYAQRVNAAGVPQWTTDGVPLCTAAGSQSFPTLAADSAHGAIVTWEDYRNPASEIYAQRVNAAGVPQWTADGVALCTAANYQLHPTVAADGAGGAIVTWQDGRNGPSGYSIYAQLVNAAGVPQWTDGGVALSTAAGNQQYPTIVTDDTGGAMVTWYVTGGGANDGIYAQRVDAAGAPQWTADAVHLCTAEGLTPTIAADGAGGAIVTWEDQRNATPRLHDIYAQRVNAAGAPQWPTNGVALCAAAKDQVTPMIVSDGSYGAIVTWEDYRNGTTNFDIFAQRVDAGGGIAAVSPGGPAKFAVHVPHPNPTHAATAISFDLPAARRVSVGVYDVAGGLVRTLVADREFPAGSPSLVWNGAGDSGAPARAGIYFVRVTVGGASIARRVAILR